MTYQEWMSKINELLKPYRKQQVRNRHTYKAYRSGQSPKDFVLNRKGNSNEALRNKSS